MCSMMPRIYAVACALMLAGARGFVVNPALRAPCANRGAGTDAAGRRSLSMVSRRMYRMYTATGTLSASKGYDTVPLLG